MEYKIKSNYRMSQYTQNELNERSKIMSSQIIFNNFLNRELINELINLFDETYDKFGNKNEKISKYIKDEREARGLDNNNISIMTKIYGFDKRKSSLILKLFKNNIQFLHLSIHLTVRYLNPKNTGIIHISKNIYKGKTIRKGDRYALISVSIPKDKPKSLLFSIADGYNTPGIKNENSYENELQQEMDIIITVLNNIFNENNKYYIGRDKNLIDIHNKTNNVLRNINSHTNHTKRKNIGKIYFGPITNMPNFDIENKGKTQRKKKPNLKKRNFKIEILPETNNIKNINSSLFSNIKGLNNTSANTK